MIKALGGNDTAKQVEAVDELAALNNDDTKSVLQLLESINRTLNLMLIANAKMASMESLINQKED